MNGIELTHSAIQKSQAPQIFFRGAWPMGSRFGGSYFTAHLAYPSCLNFILLRSAPNKRQDPHCYPDLRAFGKKS
jgi:hypothetical protein